MYRSVLIAAALCAATLARAQTAPDGDERRYTFNRADDGYLRLDTHTGQVSLCSRRAVGWACQLVPDERATLEAEIARLQSEGAALRKELLAHNLPLPDGVKPTAPTANPEKPLLRLPDDADVERVVGFVRRAWRRLVELMVSLHNDVLDRT